MKSRTVQFIVALFTAALLALTATVAVQAIAPTAVRTDLPTVLDGEVWDIEQFGDKVIVAGNFQQVRKQNSSLRYDQPNLFAYDINTCEIDLDFFPDVNGTIRDIEVADDGFYIAGKFTTIDGVFRERVAKFDRNLDLDTWKVFGTSAVASTIAADDDWVYFGGQFTSVDGNNSLDYIARATTTTGAVDHNFDFTWGQSIGRGYVNAQGQGVRTNGVSRIDLADDGRAFVSHRHLTVNGQNLSGLFQYDNGLVNNWTARRPGGANLYNAQSCAGSILPRDLEISPDSEFLVIVHQGHDRGVECDTAVKISLDGNGVYDWSSRIFDSVFSVGITNDAIYVGGHFRWLVTESAPSAFPGLNDGTPYNANPNLTTTSFYRDLVAPGYVVRTDQFGAITIDGGRAIESFNPGTNTQIGVLGITAVDRGLLIGQHNNNGTWDVIAGELVGRSAFFDNGEATIIPPICSATILQNGDVLVEWQDLDVSIYNVVRNGSWVGSRQGQQLVDTNADVNGTYSLRVRDAGVLTEYSCETTNPGRVIDTPTPAIGGAQFCTVRTLTGGGVEYSWEDIGLNNYNIRKNGQWIATVSNGTSYIDSSATGNEVYEVRVRINGVTDDRTCTTTNGNGNVASVCEVAVANGRATITWDDLNKNNYNVRKNGGWLSTTNSLSLVDSSYQTGDSYTVRISDGGVKIDHSCTI